MCRKKTLRVRIVMSQSSHGARSLCPTVFTNLWIHSSNKHCQVKLSSTFRSRIFNGFGSIMTSWFLNCYINFKQAFLFRVYISVSYIIYVTTLSAKHIYMLYIYMYIPHLLHMNLSTCHLYISYLATAYYLSVYKVPIKCVYFCLLLIYLIAVYNKQFLYVYVAITYLTSVC